MKQELILDEKYPIKMEDLDEIFIDAESIINPFYFNQVSDDYFKSKVIEIVRGIVSRSERGDTGRFDSSALRTALFNSTESACGNSFINWNVLATNYDEKCRRLSTRSSPLEILMNALKDPTVVPVVFTDAIITGLLYVSMSIMPDIKPCRRYKRKPSLKYIEDYIVQLLSCRPICLISECFGNFLRGNTRRFVSQESPAGIDGEVKSSSKGLLVARDVCNALQSKRLNGHIDSVKLFIPLSMITHNLMILIRFVDDKLTQLNSGPVHESRVKCSRCYEMNDKKKRKRVHTSSINDLHDENSDYEEDQKRLKSNSRRYPTQIASGMVSLKSILAASSQKSLCEICSVKQQMTGKAAAPGSIPSNLSEFRPLLYNLFMESVPRMISCSAVNFDTMVRKCLRLAFQYPSSASVRLCLTIIFSYSDEKGYIRGLNVLIGFIKSTLLLNDGDGKTWANLVSYLNIYLEIVCECKVFDEPSLCWKATKLLLDLALCLDTDAVPVKLSMLLCCTGWLISKRLGTLMSIRAPDVASSFCEYSLKFASQYGNSAYWFHEGIEDNDRKEIFIGLQRAGILSFMDEPSEIDFAVQVNPCSIIRPYEVSQSSRMALSRSGLKMDSLFTNHTAVLEEARTPEAQRIPTSRERDDALFSEPLMDYLNNDLIRCVLSYLGYKKLIHASMVCKSWQDIANETIIWKDHYIRRFKPTFLYDYLPRNVSRHEREIFISKYCHYENMDWKSIFRDKWLKERSSSTRRIGPKKLRCCNLIGCLTIIQKKQDYLRHQLVHEKYCLNKIQVVKRIIQTKNQKQS